jgi:hypothetical protein
MAKRTSRKNEKQPETPEKKADIQVKIAFITGIVTIFTAIITVIGGPVILKMMDRTPVPEQSSSVEKSSIEGITQEPAEILSPTHNVQTYKPMTESDAVITGIDGVQTIIPADTLRFCLSSGTTISLSGGHIVALDTMRRIDIERAEPPGGKTLFAITLLDNSVVRGRRIRVPLSDKFREAALKYGQTKFRA